MAFCGRVADAQARACFPQLSSAAAGSLVRFRLDVAERTPSITWTSLALLRGSSEAWGDKGRPLLLGVRESGRHTRELRGVRGLA